MTRENTFDGIRLVAAFMVLYGHSFALLGKVGPSFLGYPFHVIGVCIFFTISGYLVSKSAQRSKSVWTYFYNRSLRIFPALWVCVIVTIITFSFLSKNGISSYFSDSLTFRYLYNSILYIQFHLPAEFGSPLFKGVANGSLWSIPIEWVMYIIAFIIFIKSKFSPIVLLFFVGLTIVSANLFPNFLFYNMIIHQFSEVSIFFFIGSAIHLLEGKIPLSRLYSLVLLLIAFAIGDGLIKSWLTPVIISYATISFGIKDSFFGAQVRRIGDISYGTYLYAFPTQQLFITLFEIENPNILTLACVPPVAILAFISWKFIELPFLNLKHLPVWATIIRSPSSPTNSRKES